MQKTRNKKRLGKMTMANKITFLYGGVFAVIFLLTSIFMVLNANLYYRDLSKKEIDQTADEVTEYILSGQTITAEALKEINPNKYVQIRVINLSQRREMIGFNEELPFMPPSDANEEKRMALRAEMEGLRPMPRHMFDERKLEYDGSIYVVQVYREYASEHKMLRLFTILFVIVNILGIGAAFLIGRYISRQMLKPISVISQTAERITIEDLSRRIEVGEPDDELKRLSITFNDMFDRLESAFKKQNQFISDASHELRTPISVIQGYANLIDRWGKRDPDILQESIDSIKAETEHMAVLIKKLLFLARGDQEKVVLHKTEVSLNHVAAEVVRESELMESGHSISLAWETEEMIWGDYDLIKQMLWIFVENSMKYAGDKPGEIVVKVSFEDGKSCLAVADNGIGMSEEDVPNIFERFYRGDKSRSNEVPGTGLGLSIADWIVQKHNAKVEVNSVWGEGTEVSVYFEPYQRQWIES